MATTKDKKDKVREPTKTKLPILKPGLTISVHQKIKELNAKGEEKERTQVFEGMVIAVRKPKSKEGTFTIRKISNNVGVEKIIPLNSPNIQKIEIKKKAKVRRAKLYFTRNNKKRLKEKKVA